MKIATIVGARPQFIKTALVSRALREAGHEEFLIHTGQHYDKEMSQVFFRELEIPEPDINLEIGSGCHGWQTGQMLIGIERLLMTAKPDVVVVYGDTNSTLAGALAASKLHVPVAHVEAGLRSHNKTMPEEVNRILTDHVSSLLLCPTPTAVANLVVEGIRDGIRHVGDVMKEAMTTFLPLTEGMSSLRFTKRTGPYALATVHRAENTRNPWRLSDIMSALEVIGLDMKVIMPLHPRTREAIQSLGSVWHEVQFIEPVSYLEMLLLEKEAEIILTDSGGVQKEACWLKVPCVTLRDETEWVETVTSGWNVLAGADINKIIQAAQNAKPGNGGMTEEHVDSPSRKIVEILEAEVKNISFSC